MAFRPLRVVTLASVQAGGCTLGPSFVRSEPPPGGYAHAAPPPTADQSSADRGQEVTSVERSCEGWATSVGST